MRVLYLAVGTSSMQYGQQVLVRTARGIELGTVLVEASEHVVSQMPNAEQAQIVRSVNEADSRELARIEALSREEFSKCNAHIQRLNLKMKLVDVEHIFGGERIVVYYLAENRVDFRQLVRDLGNAFQTRVEMRQIGVRDESKVLADYGDCGKPVCCNTHLSAMPPVSMRMAKLQKATLDPSKISGRCGRLKCCLRYEYDTYDELQRELPPIGASVLTRDGKVTVIGQEILAQQLLVRTDDKRRILIDVSDVLSVVKSQRSDDNQHERSEPSRQKKSPKKKNNRSSKTGKRESK